MTAEAVGYDVVDAETIVWRAFVAAWWGMFQDEEVSTDTLFLIARTMDGPAPGGRWGRYRKSRFFTLLGQRRGCVVAGYRVTPNRMRNHVQMWRLLLVQPRKPDGSAGDASAAPVALIEAFTPSPEWQEVPDGYPCPPGGEFRLDFATGKNWARWPSQGEVGT
jgi:hypothetical protein